MTLYINYFTYNETIKLAEVSRITVDYRIKTFLYMETTTSLEFNPTRFTSSFISQFGTNNITSEITK